MYIQFAFINGTFWGILLSNSVYHIILVPDRGIKKFQRYICIKNIWKKKLDMTIIIQL